MGALSGKRAVLAGGTLAALLALARGQDAARPAGPPRPLELLVAGEQLGNLEPCNCVVGMLGGLPRRLSALARERTRADVLALDLGDLTGHDLHPALLERKTRAALDLLAHGEVAAVAVGEKDLRLGPELLARSAAQAGVTLLCANLRAAGGGRPFLAARRLANGERAVVVAAVLDPTLGDTGDPQGGLEVTDPDAAAREALADAPAGALRVLLYHGSREQAFAALGVDLPADVVVCGHEREAARPPVRRGAVLFVETVRDARQLARVTWAAPSVVATSVVDAIPLDGEVPDDPWARQRVDEYYRDVAGLPEPPRRHPPEGGQFVGAETCRACHQAQFDKLAATPHHDAYRKVLAKDPARGPLPECTGCHVTGWGFDSGFRSLEETPGLAEVGCEACHGVGGDHAQAPRKGYGVRAGFPGSWRATCVRCHDASNSPGFDFEAALQRIKHWPDR
jgi:hypothetical protein